MEWTVVRPGGLKNEPGTGGGLLTESRAVCGAISREDVAELVVKALFSANAAGKVPPAACFVIVVVHAVCSIFPQKSIGTPALKSTRCGRGDFAAVSLAMPWRVACR